MGVRCLTTLVNKHQPSVLKVIPLRDTKLVLDGQGLLFSLGFEALKEWKHFLDGTEYDIIQSHFQLFFQNLLKCNCTPYVIFDGSSDLDRKKEETLRKRYGDTLTHACGLFDGGPKYTFMPSLALEVLIQVLTDMHVNFAVCQFEADRDIAYVANQFQCPVVAEDSDFYVMNITGGYIPLSSLKWRTIRRNEYDEEIMWAQIYRVESFCRIYKVNKGMLPLFASLAGNDYVESASVQPFLASHVYGKYGGYINSRVSNLKELLTWLSEQSSPGQVLEDVCRFIKCDTLKEHLLASMEAYNLESDSTGCLQSFFEGNWRQTDLLKTSPLCAIIGAPVWVAEAHQKGQFPTFCIDILNKRSGFSKVQVENPKEPCAWMTSKFLFQTLSGILLGDSIRKEGNGEDKDCNVQIITRVGTELVDLEFPVMTVLEGYGKLPCLSEMGSLTNKEKRKLLLLTLAPSLHKHEHDEEIDKFPIDVRLALLSTIPWMNSSESRISEFHIHALLLGWIVQSSFMQKKIPRYPTPRTNCAERINSEQVGIEAITVKVNFVRYMEKISVRPGPVSYHGYAQWHHCHLYAVYLNQVLQLPIPKAPDLSVLFSGVTMYHLYALLRYFEYKQSDGKAQDWIQSSLFRNAPRAHQLYTSLREFVFRNVTPDALERIRDNSKKAASVHPKSSSHTPEDPDAEDTAETSHPTTAEPEQTAAAGTDTGTKPDVLS